MGHGLTAGESDYCSTEDGKTGSPQIDWSGPKVLRLAGAAKSDELIRRLAATVVLSSVRSVRWQSRHAPRWSGRSLAACVGQRVGLGSAVVMLDAAKTHASFREI